MAGKNVRVKLERVTINNPHLFKKKATIEGGTEKYRANFTMDPSTKAGKKNLAKMEEAIDEALMSVFGKTEVKIKEDRKCLQDGNDITNEDGDVYAGYEDMMVVRSSSTKRPQVKDRDPEVDLTEEDDKIYGGAVVTAHLDVWATNDKKLGGNGVFATLVGVQFKEDGERFGGSSKVSDDDWDEDDGDDEDDEPKSKKKPAGKKSRDDDEDDEPKAKKKSKRSRDDDEDEDDEDEKPKKKAKRSRDDDDDDEDDHPRSKSKAKSRRSRDDDDDDLDDEDL